MKIVVCSIAFVTGFVLSGCDSNSGYDYDKGYEAAWDEAEEPSWYSSTEYKEGYEQGQEDAEVYDMGYYDGYNEKKSAYLQDPDYMDGFKDGVRGRKGTW